MTDTTVPRTTFRGFLFADLRGYSDYVERHGDHAAVALLNAYRELVRSTVERYDGAEIRTEGDSFFVVFGAASRAVSCAMEIAARATHAEPPIDVGVGVHAGEAADTGEGPVGSAVNIAARVCAQAGRGEVVVTDMVRALTRTLVPYRFVPRGTPVLKGITEPVPLFLVADPAGSIAPAPRWRPARNLASRKRVAGIGLAIFAVLAVGLGRWIFVARGPAAEAGSTGPPLPSSTAMVVASPTSLATLSPPERDLVSRLAGLPPEVRAACRSATAFERANGASTSVTCPLPSTEGASSVHYDQFDQSAAMLTAFDAYARAHADPSGDCAKGPLGGGPWDVLRISQGHVLCFPEAGTSRIVWTYEGGDGAGIMGSAQRDDNDWLELYGWWMEVHPLLGH